jgi:cytochrome c553
MSAGRLITIAGFIAVAILRISFASCALAADSSTRQPDSARGAVIAAQGVGSGVPACAQCHAFNGGSDGSGAFPRIAGQPIQYLVAQLRDFASGVRSNAVMSPIAKALSSDDLTEVAAYYANNSAPFLPLKDADQTLVKRGEQLATFGDESKQLQSCNNCHGPGGAGEPPMIPYLAGQYAHYTAFELQMWKRGYRKNSPEAMLQIAKKLDDQDIQAVAAYFQQARGSSQAATMTKE